MDIQICELTYDCVYDPVMPEKDCHCMLAGCSPCKCTLSGCIRLYNPPYCLVKAFCTCMRLWDETTSVRAAGGKVFLPAYAEMSSVGIPKEAA